MLLFIYTIFVTCQVIFCYFNTSHVTVYLYATQPCHRSVACISIHLMLLFILDRSESATVSSTFQYISCYCLSQPKQMKEFSSKYFNTSHVTVYRHRQKSWKYRWEISIHLMLLFITVSVGFASLVNKFQYISCYCLSVRFPPS